MDSSKIWDKHHSCCIEKWVLLPCYSQLIPYLCIWVGSVYCYYDSQGLPVAYATYKLPQICCYICTKRMLTLIVTLNPRLNLTPFSSFNASALPPVTRVAAKQFFAMLFTHVNTNYYINSSQKKLQFQVFNVTIEIRYKFHSCYCDFCILSHSQTAFLLLYWVEMERRNAVWLCETNFCVGNKTGMVVVIQLGDIINFIFWFCRSKA